MLTESEITEWVLKNWPSIVMTVFMVKAYLKLRQFPVRLARLERQVKRVTDVCYSENQDRGGDLFRDEEGKED